MTTLDPRSSTDAPAGAPVGGSNRPPHPATAPLSRVGKIAAVNLGNVLEWYDWTIFAIFSVYFAHQFFPSGDAVAQLLSTFAVFAAGFLVRPLGGLFFGRFADKHGRHRNLVVTMTLVALSGLLIGLGPTHSSIGIGAAFWLLSTRLLQGFAHGGELGGSYTYLAEVATPRNRGLVGSTITMSTVGGTVLATFTGAILSSALSEAQLMDWGWRIPFILGAALGLVALYLRRRLEETESFERAAESAAKPAADHTTTHPASTTSSISFAGAMLRVGIIVAATTVVNYTWSVSAPAFATTFHGVSIHGAMWAGVAANIVFIVMIALAGALSDRWGRRRNMVLWAVAVTVIAYPLQLMLNDSALVLVAVMSIALICQAFGAAVQVAWFAELFSTSQRATGIGVAVSVAAALFGGTAPYINTWLADHQLSIVFTFYVMALAIACGVAALFTPETKGARI